MSTKILLVSQFLKTSFNKHQITFKKKYFKMKFIIAVSALCACLIVQSEACFPSLGIYTLCPELCNFDPLNERCQIFCAQFSDSDGCQQSHNNTNATEPSAPGNGTVTPGVNGTDPATTIAPITPGEPTTTVAPAEPDTPVDPDVSGKPVTPVAPVDPIAPVAPETPTSSDAPNAAVSPTTTVAPAETTETSGNGSASGKPETPVDPSAPINPEAPAVTPIAPTVTPTTTTVSH